VASPRRTRHKDTPVRITTAPTSAGDDLDRRRRRYLFSMAIRTLCFVGAVVVGPGWLRWVLVVGAFILPYVAVVMANSASPRVEGADLVRPDPGYKELGG
jgi:Flp pilus assembly protein TadB